MDGRSILLKIYFIVRFFSIIFLSSRKIRLHFGLFFLNVFNLAFYVVLDLLWGDVSVLRGEGGLVSNFVVEGGKGDFYNNCGR